LNAIIGCAILGKRLWWPRWVALAIICGAVAMTSAAQLRLKGVDVGAQTLGISAGVAANLLVSFVYVGANWLLEKPWDREVPKPMVLAQMLGVMEVSVIAVYQAVYVLPRWDEMVTSNMKPDASTSLCVGLYVVYILVCGVHQYAFYYTCSLGPTGAITAGINKCVQTAGLFFISNALFCSVAASQCLSSAKVASALSVCAGVMLYSWLGSKEGQPAEAVKEQEDA